MEEDNVFEVDMRAMENVLIQEFLNNFHGEKKQEMEKLFALFQQVGLERTNQIIREFVPGFGREEET